MKIFKKAILPLGFKACGLASGIKSSGKADLALFYSSLPAKAACKFTANKIQAAPLKVCQKYLKANIFFHALIANSGNANCFTAKTGLSDAEKMAEVVARPLGINKQSVLVASTGIIGKRLPIEKIKKAAPQLIKGLSIKGITQAKKAILTTDTFSKEVTVKFSIGKKQVTICGIAKGAGMIAPNMATMLCFIFTDVNIAQPALNKALNEAVENSFNCITVDGCMSTNDTVAVLANGSAGNRLVTSGLNFKKFHEALSLVSLELAKMIVRDAEGATKFIQINVKKAKNSKEAKLAALAIANSNLFKTAVYGENPNFGRIAAAVGASGIDVGEKDLKIKVSPLNRKEVTVDVYINRGKAGRTIYTADLTPQYIKINAEYN